MALQTPQYISQPATAFAGAEASLAEVTRFLRRRWTYIFGTAFVVTLIATLIVMQAPKRFTATSTVAVQAQKSQLVDVEGVLSGISGDEATMATQASILRSTKLTGLLIDKLKLDQDPEFNAALVKPKFSLFRISTWFGSNPEPLKKLTQAEVERHRTQMINSVAGGISIDPAAKSYVIAIAVTTKNPMKSMTIANTLADLYIQDGIDAKYEATRRASAYLQDRVTELRGDVVRTDRDAEVYRARAGLTGSSEESTIDTQQLSELNSQLIIARSERAAKEAQLSQIRSMRNGDLNTSSAILGSALIQRLREQESEVQRNLANLQSTYGANHPKIINANAELTDIRAKIQEEVNKVAASTANDVTIARTREGSLAGSLASLEGRVNRGGEAGVRLRELEREADANKTVYQTFLNRLKQTTQDVDAQTPDSRIISPATIPLAASSPRVTMTLMLALMAGLLLGTLLSLVLDKLDNTIRGANELEALGGGVTLTFLPVVSAEYSRPEDIVIERPQAMATEALRTLRSALALSDIDNPPKVVMLSSSVPAEGKTFVSTGLARVAAQAGLRTILVDADMRHPRIHHATNMMNERGLVQVLSGQASLVDTVQVDGPTGLNVLTAGTGVVNPPDLLRSEHMKQLLQTLRATYDMVIIDTPPFVPMTDSQIIATMVDKMVLVVRWGSTPVPVVQNVIKQIRRLDAPLVGSVLSRVHFARQASYGYGDYGYHYSRYAAYYGSQE